MKRNYGFAEANNIGIRYALETQDPDYFLLLNNDTVVDKQFLTELVGVAESDQLDRHSRTKNVLPRTK